MMNTSVLLWAFTFLILSLSLLFWWLQRPVFTPLAWDIDLDSPLHLAPAPDTGPPVRVSLYGSIPKQMYQGDSAIVILDGSARSHADVEMKLPGDSFVRLQLLAPGFAIDGDHNQDRHILDSAAQLSFRWGIRPLSSGLHELAITAFLLDAAGEEADIDTSMHRIHVVKFLGMTARQLQWFSIGGFILSSIMTALSVWGILK